MPDQSLQADQEKLLKIQRRVFSVGPPWIDREQCSIDLFMEHQDHLPTMREVRSRVIDLIRREKARPHVELLIDPVDLGSNGNELDQALIAKLMDQAKLTPQEEHIVFLLYYLSMTLIEISDYLGLPYSQVQNLHTKAITQLRKVS